MGSFIKQILGFIQHLLFFIRLKHGLYVINYHGTPNSVIHNFRRHIRYYKKHFQIIGPEDLGKIYAEKNIRPAKKPLLLLTFDDGMKNNRHAVTVLNEANIKALFFVIPAFIESDQPEKYLNDIIRPGYANAVEKDAEDFQALNLEELRQILDMGHKAGSHTYSHTLVKQDTETISEFEIAESRTYLENKLSVEVPYFCSINNTGLSIGETQQKIIKSHYRYHFTTFYGDNATLDPYRIQRINVESYWNMNAVYFAMGGIRKILFKK